MPFRANHKTGSITRITMLSFRHTQHESASTQITRAKPQNRNFFDNTASNQAAWASGGLANFDVL
jgi:hypothetical protein